jgi:hypothetical protein
MLLQTRNNTKVSDQFSSWQNPVISLHQSPLSDYHTLPTYMANFTTVPTSLTCGRESRDWYSPLVGCEDCHRDWRVPQMVLCHFFYMIFRAQLRNFKCVQCRSSGLTVSLDYFRLFCTKILFSLLVVGSNP